MTLAILDFPPQAPGARDLMERALEPHLLIGMPHLTPHGLSETWLMKELGHRHWLLLARDMDMANADFRTTGGAEAYAAICATSLRQARLDLVSANNVLTIRSTLAAVSRTQMSTVHRLFVGTTPIAEVELLSTFVHRLAEGDNYSIARVQLAGKPAAACLPNPLAKRAAELRARKHQLTAGMCEQDCSPRFRFDASPSQEFNGAGLFYFAEFQAVMERAYEQLFPAVAASTQISHRDVFFFGNLQQDESLYVDIDSGSTGGMVVDCRVFREDGTVIATSHALRIHRH